MATPAERADKRAILYYPTISVPDGRWLRQAILYWDEIGSIVSDTWDERQRAEFSTPETEFLENVGQYRAHSPQDLLRGPRWTEIKELHKEFKEIIKSDLFAAALGFKPSRIKRYRPPVKLNARIHLDKVSGELFHYFLKPNGLAEDNDDGWFMFEEKTALLYMSLLAKHLADVEIGLTVPATDREEYETLVYGVSSRRRGFECIGARFINALPIPRENVPLTDIIEFKSRRSQELLHFRQELDAFQEQLSEVEAEKEINKIVFKFKESLEREVADLAQILGDGKIKTTAGTLRSLINMKSPTFWGTIGLSFVHAANVANVPLEWAIPGLALGGAIEIGYQVVDGRNAARASARKSGFAFVYRAHQEHLLRKGKSTL
jgi:hypothetical protein